MKDLFGLPITEPSPLTFHQWKIREGNVQYRTDLKQVSNTALLAYLLRDHRASERLLSHFGNLPAIAEATALELKRVKGITAAKAEALIAAFELSRRVASTGEDTGPFVTSPMEVYQLLKSEMEGLQQEILKLLCLNTKNRVTHVEAVFKGSLNCSMIHPREVFYCAIRHCAASIIIVHNHPSGDPSPEDIQATKQLAQTGQLVQILLSDHVIIGNGSYFSMKAENLL